MRLLERMTLSLTHIHTYTRTDGDYPGGSTGIPLDGYLAYETGWANDGPFHGELAPIQVRQVERHLHCVLQWALQCVLQSVVQSVVRVVTLAAAAAAACRSTTSNDTNIFF
jgi:hypothetical protein